VPLIWRDLKDGWSAETVFAFWGPLFPAGLLIALIASVGIVYCVMRVWQIRQSEWAGFRKVQHTVSSEDVPRTQLRWRRVLDHASSDDEHKWRLAILEADIMLNELL